MTENNFLHSFHRGCGLVSEKGNDILCHILLEIIIHALQTCIYTYTYKHTTPLMWIDRIVFYTSGIRDNSSEEYTDILPTSLCSHFECFTSCKYWWIFLTILCLEVRIQIIADQGPFLGFFRPSGSMPQLYLKIVHCFLPYSSQIIIDTYSILQN
jgi:hypothetical protein